MPARPPAGLGLFVEPLDRPRFFGSASSGWAFFVETFALDTLAAFGILGAGASAPELVRAVGASWNGERSGRENGTLRGRDECATLHGPRGVRDENAAT